jgi:hypothetical protein
MKKKHEKLLEQAQYSMRLSSDAVIEIWNHSNPHFNWDAPHRYDEGESECSYCLRPKDWKPTSQKRSQSDYLSDVYGVSLDLFIFLGKMSYYVEKSKDSKSQELLKNATKAMAELKNHTMQISVFGHEKN